MTSDTVSVGLIVGTTGVLAGLTPAFLTGRFTRRQATDEAKRQHADWLRENRYAACTDLLDAANMMGHRTQAMKREVAASETLPADFPARFFEGLAPLFSAVNRLGVLGPPELANAAGIVGQAAIGCQTANVGGGEEERSAADQVLGQADLAFREVAYRMLATTDA